MSYDSRLSRAFHNAPVLPLHMRSRYVLISDCHRGSGNSNDNFLKNQNLYFTALKHYYDCGFTYIELGDGDELWENRKMRKAVSHQVFLDMQARGFPAFVSLKETGNISLSSAH